MIIAWVCSAIGAFCLAYSSFTSYKDDMLRWQIADYVFTATANFLLGGYTGTLTIGVSLLRNHLILKEKTSKSWIFLIIVSQISLGYLVNALGPIGYLPILSAVSSTLANFLTTNIQWLRWVIVENMLLWFIYDITIKAYPAALMDLLIASATLFAIMKHYLKRQ